MTLKVVAVDIIIVLILWKVLEKDGYETDDETNSDNYLLDIKKNNFDFDEDIEGTKEENI